MMPKPHPQQGIPSSMRQAMERKGMPNPMPKPKPPSPKKP